MITRETAKEGLSRGLSTFLAATLILLSPGAGCYDAVAQYVHAQAGALSAPAAIPGQLGIQALASAAAQTSLSNPHLSVSLSQSGLSVSVPVPKPAASVTSSRLLAPGAQLSAASQPALLNDSRLPAAYNLRAAARALSGDAKAGKDLPSFAHLGAETPASKPDAGATGLQADADAAFRKKAGLGAAAPVVNTALRAVEPAALPPLGKSQRLLESKHVRSSLAGLDAAVEMSASHPFSGKEAVDPQDSVAQDVDQYIAYKGIPNSKKHFVFYYFEIGIPGSGQSKVIDAIKKLKKAGIRTTIITDFNQSLTGRFPKGEAYNTDYGHAAYKDNEPGAALKLLRRELGFKLSYGAGRFTVLSGVPLYNAENVMISPLMHEKGWVAVGPKGKAYRFARTGTANMNETESFSADGAPGRGGRMNRDFLSKDKAANQAFLDHVWGEISAFNRRLGAAGLSSELDRPRRIEYANGEFQEIVHSDGRQNPNDRVVDMLNRATDALIAAKARQAMNIGRNIQPEFEIEEVILSHFVFSYAVEVDALRRWLAALQEFYPNDYQNRAKVFGIFDQQFISPTSWGQAAALAGIMVRRPLGKIVFPFSKASLEMMRLFGYIRLMPGADKIDPDGKPTKVHLWHDKTTIIKTKEKDSKPDQTVRWTNAFSGSFNASTAYRSLESQTWYRMRPGSRLAREFEDSIKEVVKAEPQFAVELDKAVVMSWLARFTQHTIYDFGIRECAEKIIGFLSGQNYEAAKTVLAHVAGLPTKNFQPQDAGKVASRIGKFIAFLNWYQQEAAKEPSLYKMTWRKAVSIGVGLMTDQDFGLDTALHLVYFNPSRDAARTRLFMERAWSEGLGMTTPLPGKVPTGSPEPPALGRPEAAVEPPAADPASWQAVKARKLTDAVFTVFDIETTGLMPEIHKPIQIGAVKIRFQADGSFTVVDSFEKLVDPKMPVAAVITDLTNITPGELRNQPGLAQVLPEFAKFVGDSVLIAHNAPFDANFLAYRMKEAGLRAPKNMILDTLDMVKSLFPEIAGKGGRKVEDLKDLWKIAGAENHNARADSMDEVAILARVVGRLAQNQGRNIRDLTVGDLAAASSQLDLASRPDALAGRAVPPARRQPIPPDLTMQQVIKLQSKLYWSRQPLPRALSAQQPPSQLRDVAQWLGWDYERLKAELSKEAMSRTVESQADSIAAEVVGNPPAALFIDYAALADKKKDGSSRPVGSDTAAGISSLLGKGVPVGIVAPRSLDAQNIASDFAYALYKPLVDQIPAGLRKNLFFAGQLRGQMAVFDHAGKQVQLRAAAGQPNRRSRGAELLYAAMRERGFRLTPENLGIIGAEMRLPSNWDSAAAAFPKSRAWSVGDSPDDTFAGNVRRMGIGHRGTLRILNAALQGLSRPASALERSAPPALPPAAPASAAADVLAGLPAGVKPVKRFGAIDTKGLPVLRTAWGLI